MPLMQKQKRFEDTKEVIRSCKLNLDYHSVWKYIKQCKMPYDKMKNKKYHSVRTASKSNRKIFQQIQNR